MVRKSTAVHKNNEYEIFKSNSLFCNNKNIRNACPKLPALTVSDFVSKFILMKWNEIFFDYFLRLLSMASQSPPRVVILCILWDYTLKIKFLRFIWRKTFTFLSVNHKKSLLALLVRTLPGFLIKFAANWTILIESSQEKLLLKPTNNFEYQRF